MALHAEPRLQNLPAPLNTFIGREIEVSEIKQRLSAVRHLVVITHHF